MPGRMGACYLHTLPDISGPQQRLPLLPLPRRWRIVVPCCLGLLLADTLLPRQGLGDCSWTAARKTIQEPPMTSATLPGTFQPGLPCCAMPCCDASPGLGQENLCLQASLPAAPCYHAGLVPDLPCPYACQSYSSPPACVSAMGPVPNRKVSALWDSACFLLPPFPGGATCLPPAWRWEIPLPQGGGRKKDYLLTAREGCLQPACHHMPACCLLPT